MSGDDAAAHDDDETADDDWSDDIDIVHHHDDCGDDCPGKLLEHVLDQLAANEFSATYNGPNDIIVHVNDDVIHYVNDVNDGAAGSGRVPERG